MAQDKAIGALVEELRDLVTGYVRQETVEPAKFLGKSFAFSVLGGTVLGCGFAMLLLGVLRLLQAEVWVFPQGRWSWLPYLLTAVVGIAVVGIAAGLVQRRSNGAGTEGHPG